MILEAIKDAVVYLDGTSYFGATEDVKLPDLQFKAAEHKPNGGIGSFEMQDGLDKMDTEIKFKTYDRDLARGLLRPGKAASLMIRSRKVIYDASGSVTKELALVTHMRVVTKSFPLGDHKEGQGTETQWKGAVHMIRQTLDGKDLIEIDVINQVYKIDGEDQLGTRNQLLGI